MKKIVIASDSFKGISRKSMCLSIDLSEPEQEVFNIRHTS